MKNAGLFVILIFRRKDFEKSTCFLLAGLIKECDCVKKAIKITLVAIICLVALFWIAIETNPDFAVRFGLASGPGKPVDDSTNIVEIIETSESPLE